MKRSVSIVAMTLFAFAMASANICPPISPINLPQNNESSTKSKRIAQNRTITILFHGLMVGRLAQRFEVGVVRKLIGQHDNGHTFSLQEWKGTGDPVPIPGNPLQTGTYEFEVEGLQQGGVEPHMPQQGSFRRDQIPTSQWPDADKDYRYIINIQDDMHPNNLRRRPNAFQYIFHVLKGRVQSRCLTDSPVEKRVISDATNNWTGYGFITEIVGVEIDLSGNQQLVLRRRGETTPLWQSDNSTVEVRVLNLPPKELRKSRADEYITTACTHETGMPQCTSHFPYYYTHALDVDMSEAYELRLKVAKSKGLRRFEKGKKGQVGIRTIYPYRCGMVLLNSNASPIE